MILNKKTLSMAEASEYLNKDSGTEIKGFIKKFSKIKPEKAKELRKKIEEINNLKIKEEHITKVIDLLPESKEDLNKVFSDASLDENEAKQIIDTIKEFK